jgi:hypothetical protein
MSKKFQDERHSRFYSALYFVSCTNFLFETKFSPKTISAESMQYFSYSFYIAVKSGHLSKIDARRLKAAEMKFITRSRIQFSGQQKKSRYFRIA